MDIMKNHEITNNDNIEISRNKPSKLDPFKKEIMILKLCGMSYRKIAEYLDTENQLKVTPRNIQYRMEQWLDE